MKAYRVLSMNLLALGMVAGLAACGGSDPQVIVPPTPVAPATTPPPTTGINLPGNCGVAGDYVRTCIIPYLQSYYGNVVLQSVVQIPTATNGTVTLNAGTYSWEQIYTQAVEPVARGCGCLLPNLPNNGISIMGQVNYGQLYSAIGFSSYNMPAWAQTPVLLQSQAFGQVYSTFGFVFNQLISVGYSYYQTYYYPNYYPGYYYMPGNWAGNGYYGNNGFSLGVGYGGDGLSLGFSGSFGW
jgi:hypothetical protein